jgi:hypothetical protein
MIALGYILMIAQLEGCSILLMALNGGNKKQLLKLNPELDTASHRQT